MAKEWTARMMGQKGGRATGARKARTHEQARAARMIGVERQRQAKLDAERRARAAEIRAEEHRA